MARLVSRLPQCAQPDAESNEKTWTARRRAAEEARVRSIGRTPAAPGCHGRAGAAGRRRRASGEGAQACAGNRAGRRAIGTVGGGR